PEFLISAMNLTDGRVLWHHDAPNRSLIFASPRIVALRVGENAEQFELLDAMNGRLIKKMSRDYFLTVLCPKADSLSKLKSWQTCHAEMVDQSEAYRRARYPSGYGNWTDTAQARELFAPRRQVITTTNTWSYVCVRQFGTVAAPPTTKDFFKCDARLKLSLS